MVTKKDESLIRNKAVDRGLSRMRPDSKTQM